MGGTYMDLGKLLQSIFTVESLISGAMLTVVFSSLWRTIQTARFFFFLYKQWVVSKRYWCLEKEVYETSQRFIKHPNSLRKSWLTVLINRRKSIDALLVEHIRQYEQERDSERSEFSFRWQDPYEQDSNKVDLSDYMLFRIDEILSLNDEQTMKSYSRQAKKCVWNLGVIEALHRRRLRRFVTEARCLPMFVKTQILAKTKK